MPRRWFGEKVARWRLRGGSWFRYRLLAGWTRLTAGHSRIVSHSRWPGGLPRPILTPSGQYREQDLTVGTLVEARTGRDTSESPSILLFVLQNSWPPRVLANRYVLGRAIGGGGMGMVWQAEDQQLGRSVAIKFIQLGSGADADARERFSREARAAASLSHPNIVTVHDYGVDQGVAYMVMERLAGPDLETLVRDQGPLPIDTVLDYMGQAAAGLAAAHAGQILHRDIKPANLSLTAMGTLKILDFGIAKLADEAQHMTSTNQLMGTVAYLAPERTMSEPATIQCDLYSLGCVMMTLLTGEPPFGGTTAETLLKHVSHQPPRPSERRSDLPEALDDLALCLLAKDPDKRPLSASAVTTWLDTFRQTGASLALPTRSLTAPGSSQPPRFNLPPSAVGEIPPKREGRGRRFSDATLEPGDEDERDNEAMRMVSQGVLDRTDDASEPVASRATAPVPVVGTAAVTPTAVQPPSYLLRPPRLGQSTSASAVTGTWKRVTTVAWAAMVLLAFLGIYVWLQAGNGSSTTQAANPTTSGAKAGATEATCWNGDMAPSVDLCSSPKGVEGLRYVFPQLEVMEPRCQRAPTTLGVRLECIVGDRGLIRFRYWDEARDNRRHYEEDYAPHRATEFRLAGEPVGTVYRWPDEWEGRAYRMSALYGQDHFSVSVEAPTKAAREQLFKDTWFRRPSDFRGHPSDRGPLIAQSGS